MNKSYSKIRHVQNANILLESRWINEDTNNVYTIPPLENLPPEILNDKNNTFVGECKGGKLFIKSIQNKGVIYEIKTILLISSIIEKLYCFVESDAYAIGLGFTDIKKGEKCFVIKSNANDGKNWIMYKNKKEYVCKLFNEAVWNARKLRPTTNQSTTNQSTNNIQMGECEEEWKEIRANYDKTIENYFDSLDMMPMICGKSIEKDAKDKVGMTPEKLKCLHCKKLEWCDGKYNFIKSSDCN